MGMCHAVKPLRIDFGNRDSNQPSGSPEIQVETGGDHPAALFGSAAHSRYIVCE